MCRICTGELCVINTTGMYVKTWGIWAFSLRRRAQPTSTEIMKKKRFMINSNQILLLPRTIPRYYTVQSAFIIKIFVVQYVSSGDARMGLRDYAILFILWQYAYSLSIYVLIIMTKQNIILIQQKRSQDSSAKWVVACESHFHRFHGIWCCNISAIQRFVRNASALIRTVTPSFTSLTQLQATSS